MLWTYFHKIELLRREQKNKGKLIIDMVSVWCTIRGKNDLYSEIRGWLVDCGLTSHQQLRSYGDGTSFYSLVRQTGEALDRTCGPWVYKASDIRLLETRIQ